MTYSLMMCLAIIFLSDLKYAESDVSCSSNKTLTSAFKACLIPYSVSICAMVELMTITFIISLVWARWILPSSKRMNAENVYNQKYRYTATAADIIDLADYFQTDEVIKSYGLFTAVETVFVMSVLQFSFSMQATKKRNMKLTGWRRFIDILLSTEAWSLILSLLTQEVPSLLVRLIIIATNENLLKYSMYFFAIKNFLVSILLVYRIVVLTRSVYVEEKRISPL
jgi:hypothetical protein